MKYNNDRRYNNHAIKDKPRLSLLRHESLCLGTAALLKIRETQSLLGVISRTGLTNSKMLQGLA
jgi:hypothetical protein